MTRGGILAAMSFGQITVRMDPAGCIDEDLLCLGCGYNLRTLTLEHTCPECGRPVATSLIKGRLQDADPAWLRKLSGGALMSFILLFGPILAGMLGAAVGPLVGLVALVPMAGIGLTAHWLLTTPEPGRRSVDRRRQFVRFALYPILVGLIWAVATLADVTEFPAAAVLMLTVLGVAWMVATVGHLACFAQRLHRPHLTWSIRIAGGLCILVVLLMHPGLHRQFGYQHEDIQVILLAVGTVLMIVLTIWVPMLLLRLMFALDRTDVST